MNATHLPDVGLVGLGNMGWPMARHLVEARATLLVFDAAPGRAAAFVREVGGRGAADLADLARRSEVVITMLPDGGVVREVVLGTAGAPGLVDGIGEGGVVADMSSADPRVYPELEAALGKRGARLIDAPVSGAVTGAEQATLTIMAGGEADAIDRLAPVFARLGRRVFRTGALGTGQAMKALNNLLSAGALILTIEALLTGQRFGLEPRLMTEILNVSTGRNNSTEKKIVPHVLSRRFDSGFTLGLMVKDLTTALSIAETTEMPSELGAHTLDLARKALDRLGPDADHTAIARFIESEAGEELRAPPAG